MAILGWGNQRLLRYDALAEHADGDEIRRIFRKRRGALYVLGYISALLTAIYTFRMIFRAFLGEPVPEARELLDHGQLAHAEVPRNPLTGEEEDTDVGFPGPGHYIAERELPMKIAMSVLALGAVTGGVLQIPGVDRGIERFLEPTFADSTLARRAAGRRRWCGHWHLQARCRHPRR